MKKTDLIWLDGGFVKWEEAQINVINHGLHYGSAVFEGIRFYKTEKGPAIFRLQDHIARLIDSFSVFRMECPYSKEEIEKAVVETVRKNRVAEGYIRPIIFFGENAMGLSSLKDAGIRVAIAVWPWGSYLGENPVSVMTSSYIRLHPNSVVSEAKVTGYYINSILATIEAKKAGYEEALLLDVSGHIAEGPGENFFLIEKGSIVTPPIGNILPGITRDSVITIAKDRGYTIKEASLTLSNVSDASEAFFTGTAAEITLIGKV
ncbi:MAG TPA: branched-chain amino acid transaminase, partial [bacterium]|nr:branched-chain amino acid transaminase [bacterium]